MTTDSLIDRVIDAIVLFAMWIVVIVSLITAVVFMCKRLGAIQ